MLHQDYMYKTVKNTRDMMMKKVNFYIPLIFDC